MTNGLLQTLKTLSPHSHTPWLAPLTSLLTSTPCFRCVSGKHVTLRSTLQLQGHTHQAKQLDGVCAWCSSPHHTGSFVSKGPSHGALHLKRLGMSFPMSYLPGPLASWWLSTKLLKSWPHIAVPPHSNTHFDKVTRPELLMSTFVVRVYPITFHMSAWEPAVQCQRVVVPPLQDFAQVECRVTPVTPQGYT